MSKDAAEAERAQKYRKPGAGVVYRNRLEYRSAPLEAFTERTQQEIDAEVEQIRAKWAKPMRDKTSAQRRTVMNNEIAKARKPAPPEVKADHYLSLWLANDAALLRSELRAILSSMLRHIEPCSSFLCCLATESIAGGLMRLDSDPPTLDAARAVLKQ